VASIGTLLLMFRHLIVYQRLMMNSLMHYIVQSTMDTILPWSQVLQARHSFQDAVQPEVMPHFNMPYPTFH